MRSLAFVCALAALLAIVQAGKPSNPDYPCLAAGGICRAVDDCHPENLTPDSGLCPRAGFECCYGFPKSARTCSDFLGECMPTSHCRHPELRANDCGSGEKCCVLL